MAGNVGCHNLGFGSVAVFMLWSSLRGRSKKWLEADKAKTHGDYQWGVNRAVGVVVFLMLNELESVRRAEAEAGHRAQTQGTNTPSAKYPYLTDYPGS